MLRNNALNIYADGSSYAHPRVGGMGLRLIFVDSNGVEEVEDVPLLGHQGATNNQMELSACIAGLERAWDHPQLANVERICVFTDSRYVVDNWKNALYNWPANRWYTRSGTPVLNAGLWKDLARWVKRVRRRVEFWWVKGHANDPHNRAVDKLAKASAKGAVLSKPLSVVSVRRKTTTRSVQRGCVGMLGQRIAIQIVTSEYLPVQKTIRYKYEVVSPRSQFHGYVDVLYSAIDLRAGHRYLVSLNRKQGSPSIVAVHRELERPTTIGTVAASLERQGDDPATPQVGNPGG